MMYREKLGDSGCDELSLLAVLGIEARTGVCRCKMGRAVLGRVLALKGGEQEEEEEEEEDQEASFLPCDLIV